MVCLTIGVFAIKPLEAVFFSLEAFMFCLLYNLFCLTVNHDGQPSFLEAAVLMTVHAKDVRVPLSAETDRVLRPRDCFRD